MQGFYPPIGFSVKTCSFENMTLSARRQAEQKRKAEVVAKVHPHRYRIQILTGYKVMNF